MEQEKVIKEEQPDVQMSQDELNERRAKVTEFYRDNIEHLTVQLEYEKILTEIEEHRAKRLQAQMFIAEAMAAQQEDPTRTQAREEFDEAMDTMAKRTLKRT